MTKAPRTLSYRLTLWYISAFAVFIIAAVVSVSLTINSILNYRVNEDLTEELEEYTLFYESGELDGISKALEYEMLEGKSASEFIRIINLNGESVVDTGPLDWSEIESDMISIAQLRVSEQPVLRDFEFRVADDESMDMREIYGFVGEDTILHYGESLEANQDLMEALYYSFLVMLIIVLPSASVVGWLMARNAVRGIEEVSRTAATIHSGQLDHRVSVDSQDLEIQNLASTFNSMLDRIRELVNETRNMIDNIAHDLRSPLTRIRVISESVLTNGHSKEEITTSATQTIEECDRLLQMINVSLDVAEAESGTGNSNFESVNLSHIAKDACELFEPVAEQSQILFRCDIQDNNNIRGNVQNLQRMLANLLDNALKYTPADGEVGLKLKSDADIVVVTITDTGIGIPEDEQPQIFNRFYRCDQSRSREGCGLGLSYARAVARGHKGDITVTSEPGKGSSFIITLPAIHS